MSIVEVAQRKRDFCVVVIRSALKGMIALSGYGALAYSDGDRDPYCRLLGMSLKTMTGF